MRIGIDIMGGDFSPKKTVHGSILASEKLSSNDKIILIGNHQDILKELSKYKWNKEQFEIIHAPQIIEMGEHSTKAFKKKPDSSIVKGFDLLKTAKIDGFASAGNTGAMLVGSVLTTNTINQIIRPCISAMLPKLDGGVVVLLDVGANADCKADVLYQFGILGSLFARYICGVKHPKVSLLNLGKEKTKGNVLAQTAYSLMEDTTEYNFIGNIEAGNLFDGEADVVVCDGFTGNIVLKEAEAFYDITMKRGLKDAYFSRLNYENYGGTPILGLDKPVIIGHGVSNEIAIKNMILLTKNIIQSELINKIKETLN